MVKSPFNHEVIIRIKGSNDGPVIDEITYRFKRDPRVTVYFDPDYPQPMQTSEVIRAAISNLRDVVPPINVAEPLELAEYLNKALRNLH